MSEGVRIERASAEVVRPLRHQVLRPGRPVSESVYAADDDPVTVHVAAFLGSEVVAVGTAIAEPAPWDGSLRDGASPDGASPAWRVRGMATQPSRRGGGLGTQVLAALLDTVTAQGAAVVWCNARVPACRLYERAGFVTRGAEFEIQVIGPHVVMWRSAGLCQGIGGEPDGTRRDPPPPIDAI
jgi:GNAT superfamily N-acetyltransferase